MAKRIPRGMRYKGGGFLLGVPSRDMTPEEAAQFDYKVLLASGLYEEVKPEKVINKILVEKPEEE